MKRASATALFFLSLLAPILLGGVTLIPNWYEARLPGLPGLYVWYQGYHDVYGWIVLGCVVAYLASSLLGRRYLLLTPVVLSAGSLASLIAARQHYQGLMFNFGGTTGGTTRAFNLALIFAAIWLAQSILIPLLWRGARTSGLSDIAGAVRTLRGAIRMHALDIERALDFRTMLAPKLIRVLFVIGVVAFVSGGSFVILDGLRTINWREAAEGAGIVVLGPIIVRLVCEYSILFFRMNETLNDIHALIGPPSTALARPASAANEPPASSAS
jgi:hypothetical protein